jgi:hypothetical protein
LDADRFDTATRAMSQGPSRRTALQSTLGGIAIAAAGWLRDPPAPARAAKKKGKGKDKKKPCPECVCPAPPAAPIPFCAGKNSCAQAEDILCGTSGTDCSCQVRNDTGAPFCGVFSRGATSCADCVPSREACVRATTHCASFAFFCFTPCAIPK